MVTMLYPQTGAAELLEADVESRRRHVEGYVVRDLPRVPSNFRSHGSLDDYLVAHRILGIEGLDTRALVRRLRVRGTMTGVLSTKDLDDASLVRKAQSSPSIVGRDLVREVVPERPFT